VWLEGASNSNTPGGTIWWSLVGISLIFSIKTQPVVITYMKQEACSRFGLHGAALTTGVAHRHVDAATRCTHKQELPVWHIYSGAYRSASRFGEKYKIAGTAWHVMLTTALVLQYLYRIPYYGAVPRAHTST
jgi:hypothetical protein